MIDLILFLLMVVGFIYLKDSKKDKREDVVPTTKKIWPGYQPLEVVDVSHISDKDIKNILISLEDNPSSWKVTLFSDGGGMFLESKDPTNNLNIQIQIGGLSEGKISYLNINPGQQLATLDLASAFCPLKVDKKYYMNFFKFIWPIYSSQIKIFNDKQYKLKSEFSKSAENLVPKDRMRDIKLDELLGGKNEAN
jgi:hypothetical protein